MIRPPELEKSLMMQFACAYKAVRRQNGKELKKLGLSLGQDIILFHLSSQPEISQSQLARALGVEEATISIMLGRMARAGLIKRSADEKDARKMRVSLTAKGLKLKKKALQIWQKQEAQVFSRLTESQRKQFLALLTEIQSYAESRKDKKER